MMFKLFTIPLINWKYLSSICLKGLVALGGNLPLIILVVVAVDELVTNAVVDVGAVANSVVVVGVVLWANGLNLVSMLRNFCSLRINQHKIQDN